MIEFHAVLATAVVVVLVNVLAWWWQRRRRHAVAIDVVWAWLLGGLAVGYALLGNAPLELRALLAVMGGGWGASLAWHLEWRQRGRPESWRYARLQTSTQPSADRQRLRILQARGLCMVLLSATAFMPVAYRPELPTMGMILLALLIWSVAVTGEALAYRQLHRFRRIAVNHDRVCRRGLWAYSRHPDYFFKCLHWLAYLPLAWQAPYGWLAWLAPAVVTFSLLRLSGVPVREAHLIGRKKGYAEYMRSTNELIPWRRREV
jgi:steroid 5-alpha reductase family enzyme